MVFVQDLIYLSHNVCFQGDSKPRYTGIFDIAVESRETIETHRKFVYKLTKKDQTFASAIFHRFLP
jgi:hypothetical protein